MVVCPHCRHNSADPLFCDHCNGILPLPEPAALPSEDYPPGRSAHRLLSLERHLAHGLLAPLASRLDDRPCRLYALNRTVWMDLAASVRDRVACRHEIVAPLQIVPVGDGAVVAATGLTNAVQPLLAAGETGELARAEAALAACRTLAAALDGLHQAGLVWLNFHPSALEVGDGGIQLTNLDLQIFRNGECPAELRLSPVYSPPEVCAFRHDLIGPATDVFHASVYLYYRLAGLLPDGFPGQGLEAFDFEIPPLRVYRPRLPAGIAAVLERGLKRDPAKRFGNIKDLVGEFADAVDRARARQGFSGAISWKVGRASFVGRSHAVGELPNQDSHVVMPLPGDRLLAVVADGVTHARYGSGDAASQAAVAVFARSAPARLEKAETPDQIGDVLSETCLEASRTILDLVQDVLPAEGYDPVDVMSSTVMAGVLSGRVLTLACAGDSRTYLIANGQAEQLTVDGDVCCTRLAEGIAPEFVRDMGTEASALFYCLGVGETVKGGALDVSVARCRPCLTHWPLVPGDVVVLCSDGLVEDGVFLDPSELSALVAEYDGLPPAELAAGLVQAALARHRDPSPWEPLGCGDDVTCIVIVIGPSPAVATAGT